MHVSMVRKAEQMVLQLDSTSEGVEPSVDSLFFLMPKTVLSSVFMVVGCFFNADPSSIALSV